MTKYYVNYNHREYSKRNSRLDSKMLMGSYKTFLESEFWKLLREYAYQQPQSKECYFCRDTSGVVLHHVRYSKMYIPNLKYILPLCHSCHYRVHEVNFTKECSVVEATREVALQMGINGKTVKQLGNKNFYKKFWSCGLLNRDDEAMRKEILVFRRARRKRKASL